MRKVAVTAPSFPDVAPETPLPIQPDIRWQVMCGDAEHWRAGVFSPPESSAEEIEELERHTCPELFVLLEGRLVLLIAGASGVEELELRRGEPVLVTAPHAGFCPDGPFTGSAFVVERDLFETQYRGKLQW